MNKFWPRVSTVLVSVTLCIVLVSGALAASRSENRGNRIGPGPTKETTTNPKNERGNRGNRMEPGPTRETTTNPKNERGNRGNKIVTPPAPKKTITVPKNENASSTVKDTAKACGNGQCYSYWQEMTNPHDGRYQARLKAETAYRNCMAQCQAAPKMRR